MKYIHASIQIGLFVIALGLAFSASFFITSFAINHTPQQNTQKIDNTVKAVCDYAQSVNSTEALHACGVAQSESMTEYLCSSAYNCWIENK